MAKFNLKQIWETFGVRSGSEAPVGQFCVDSRDVQPGDLFVALPGERLDGHDFLNEAASRGAIAAIVQKDYSSHHENLPLLRVDDTLAAMQKLAQRALSDSKGRVVAITGSLGKTTTKDFIRVLLAEKYRVASSPGNYNSKIGLPLTLLNYTKGDEEVIVLEMGMTEPGHITDLVDIAPPEIALITWVDLVHAGFFESLEGIARAKAEIFTHPKTRLGIYSNDAPHADILRESGRCEKRSFSLKSNADYILRGITAGMEATERGERVQLGRLPVPGLHNVHNFLAAASVARSLDVPWKAIARAIPKLKLPAKRMEIVQQRGATFVNDAYNACTTSIKAALDSLPEPGPGGKKIAVIGWMVDLGKFSEECHHEVGKHALERVDRMLCLGEPCRPIANVWEKAQKPVDLFETREEVVKALREELQPGDVVLLKGSMLRGLWKVLDEL